MHVLGLVGSLRQGSYNQQLLLAAAAQLPPEVDFVLYGQLKQLPPYDEDDEPGGAVVSELKRAIEQADALLIATPEYNGSIPGVLKNAIDWASRPPVTSVLRNKPVAVIGASTGMFGAVWAQAELRKVLSTAGARVVGQELPVAQAQAKFAADGSLYDETLRQQLKETVEALVQAAAARQLAPVSAAA